MLSIVKQKKIKTNSNIMMIQSKLYAPSYSGAGKWVIYNTDTNKALLAVGKDKLPDIVPFLTEFSGIERTTMQINESVTKRLVSEKLLLNNDDSFSINNSPGFIELYSNSVFNFPFRDYHDPKWLEKDHNTMSHYSKLWEHPPMFTKRLGKRIFLKSINKENLNSKESSLDLHFISLLLKTVFGPLDTIKSYPVDSFRKTSPSGGAKHPTEAVVFFNQDFDNLEKGAYIYDVKEHALIKDDFLGNNTHRDGYQDSVSILIRSRVERPMWRYREIRSYRAILLDAGHIVETIRQVCEYKGLYTKVDSTLLSKDKTNFEWLQEPHLCLVHISNNAKSEKIPFSEIEDNSKESWNSSSERYMTNPTIYFTFEEGSLICNTLWPDYSKAKISFKEFEVLTHCLPSRRGDRDNSEKGIYREFLVKKSQFDKLISMNALLPEKMAKSFYHGLSPWIRHNWYLNFMVHCATHNALNLQDKNRFRNDVVVKKPTNLFKRKTCRKFTAEEITFEKFNQLLESAIPKDQKDETELIINVKNVESIDILGGIIEVRCTFEECLNGIKRFFSASIVQRDIVPDIIIYCDWEKSDRYLFRTRPHLNQELILEGVYYQEFGSSKIIPWDSYQPVLPPFVKEPFLNSFVALHAGAVKNSNNQAFLFVGSRASGKTTSTLELVNSNYQFELLTDETVYCRKRSIYVEPFPRLVLPREEINSDIVKRMLPATEAFFKVASSGAIVSHIFYLKPEENAQKPSIIEISNEESYRYLVEHYQYAGTEFKESLLTLHRISAHAKASVVSYSTYHDLKEIIHTIPHYLEKTMEDQYA